MVGNLLYFIFIGWWLGGLYAFLGYILCASVIGLPIGVILLNRLPTVVFLREPGEVCEHGHPHMEDEFPFFIRIIWFFLIGWELGLLVIVVGYLFILTLIGIPLGIWLLNRVPFVLTLRRYYG